jgi:catechol 2,3-dioxygenase
MTELGHIALRVRDLDAAVAFYRDAVGLRVVGTLGEGRAAVLTGGRQHHELLLVSAPNLEPPTPRQPLYHLAWRIGEGLDALRAAKARLDALGIPADGAVDHGVSWSLYLRDPEGNQVELFADNPAANWRQSSDWLERPGRPLDL